ncbi:MAG TPA: hypothetical protein VMU17_00905 [Elusimicrobiota bacterium]|nr:hypothetical protein [Elusimicrobiota bacterium]
MLAALVAPTLLFWSGCAAPKPARVTVPPPEVKQPTPADEALANLQGTWENIGQGGTIRKMIIEKDGNMRFDGGLEFFNPATWQWSADRQELEISMPAAEDDKLQIFKMYVGDGVKSVDRRRHLVAYHFDQHTDTLNVAGWNFTKAESNPIPAAEPEPTIR